LRGRIDERLPVAGFRLQVASRDPVFLNSTPHAQEERMEIFPGISMDAGIRFGKPCIAGTRVDVATVIGALGAGESTETVAQNYALRREQILAALRYAAHVAAHLPPAVKVP
jgi:uncharacterized protein (DUF433 family)